MSDLWRLSMHRPCRVPGCDRPKRPGYSQLCEFHRARKRRNGEWNQQLITLKTLRPALLDTRRVFANWKRKKSDVFTAYVESVWKNILEAGCNPTLYGGGNRFYQNALRVLHETWLDEACTPVAVAETCVAMIELRVRQPRLFVSDHSFAVQLCKRVRSLGAKAFGSYWHPTKQRAVKVYKDLTPAVAIAAGTILKDGYIPLSARVALQRERREQEKQLLEELAR